MAESPTSAPPGAVGARVSYEEFLERYDGGKAEWVDGWVYPMSPANRAHTELGIFLTTLLSLYTKRRSLGVVLNERFQMRLPSSGREPGILFVANEHAGRLQDTYVDGPADLVVEIVSPESQARDRGEKFFEYEGGGVREYWVLDPDRKAAEFAVLEEGRLQPRLPDGEGVYASAVVEGFWLRVDWLWTLPDPLDVLSELGVR